MAESFLDLVNRLDGDVEKMIREGVATKADGLTVKVKVNEAEMLLTKVDNGLALSKWCFVSCAVWIWTRSSR